MNSFIKSGKQLLNNLKEKLITSSVANEELNEKCGKCNEICDIKRFSTKF